MAKDFRDRVSRVLNHATKAFGEEVTYYPQAGGSLFITGIFDNEYESVDPDTEQVISANQPVLGVNLNDVSFELKAEDSVKIRNLTYKIYDVREDGQGGASLLLHRCDSGQKVFKKKGATTP